jgi:DNA-binding MarR family transcriptional regulator
LTEWVPDILEQLREASTKIVRRQTNHADAYRVSASLLDETLPEWHSLEETWDDATAEAVAYTQAITELALADKDASTTSQYDERRHESLLETVESVGTGRGAVNAGLGALAKGPVALHRELDPTPRALTLVLNGPAWTDLTDRRTGVRALAAIAVLADGFDVRVVASPALQRELARRYPRWSAIHLDLTDSRDRSRQRGHRSSGESHAGFDTTQAAWDALDGLGSEPKKRRLLGNLDAEQGRSYRDLTQDQAIDIEPGTVSRYVLGLEERGLVTVDRRGQCHTVRLSERGRTAVKQCLDTNNELVHPNQRRLDSGLTDTPHASTSTVSPRREADPRERSTAIDQWIASTGDPNGEAAFVQWLEHPEDPLDAESLHRRFTAPARGPGITLVDDHTTAFEDGRVTYLSHHHDETLVVAEWGGALATLGRLAAVLLSDKALNKILTPSRVGHEFTGIHDGVLDEDAGRTLRRGHQVGWFSADEEQYAQWRARIERVRNEQVARLTDLVGSDDTAARAALFEDLHGLVTTATQLYHAAGIDLTITLRVPDTAALADDDQCRREFCDFLRHTVPKQSVHGIHSGYRLLFESRPAKLKRRLPYDVDASDTLDLTATWVLAGPTITELQPAIRRALEQTDNALRDTVADGTEQVPALEVPVRDGTSYAAHRGLVDRIATTTETAWTAKTRQRLVRLCLRSFGPTDSPRHASPYDAAESLLRAVTTESTPTIGDVERAAAVLPASRFRLDLPPTATNIYATLLTASQPLGRQAIIEEAGLSASSYDRRIDTVRALPRVRSCTVAGYRRWRVVPDTTAVPASTDLSLPWRLSQLTVASMRWAVLPQALRLRQPDGQRQLDTTALTSQGWLSRNATNPPLVTDRQRQLGPAFTAGIVSAVGISKPSAAITAQPAGRLLRHSGGTQ